MEVSELIALTDWIDKEIVERRLVKLSAGLFAVLQNNTQPGNAKQPFLEQRQNLEDQIEKVNLSALTEEQVAVLRDGLNKSRDLC